MPEPSISPENKGLTITRDQLEAWTRTRLSDEDIAALTAALPHSSVPDALGAIVASIRERRDDPPVTYTNASKSRAIGPPHVMIPGAAIIVVHEDGLDERRIGTVDRVRTGSRPGPWQGRPYVTADLVPVDSRPPSPDTVQRRGAGAATRGAWNIGT